MEYDDDYDRCTIQNTAYTQSDLGKAKASIQFQTSQGINVKTGVPQGKNETRVGFVTQ